MSKLVISLIVGVIGIVLGVNLADSAKNPIQVESLPDTNSQIDQKITFEIAQLKAKIDDLQTQLKTEKSLRSNMQNELSDLRKQLKSLNTSNPSTSTDSEESTISEFTQNHSDSAAFSSPETEETQSTQSILASIGVDPVIAENIEQLSEKKEMDQLYLRNKAVREGWFGTEKYFRENRKLEQENNVIRDELGDEKYDEYLFASGRFNRIKVSSVLAQSPAEQAGIATGDVIVSYNDTRIFSWADLTTETAEGEPGETVEVSIMRNNEISRLFIPRGPMGVRLESFRTEPNSGT